MVWFPSALDTTKDGWRFDAVSLLAVIGESIIERQKHFITASTLSGIPRLLPAPQAVVTSNQLTKLPAFDNVTVFGVHSGSHMIELNYFAGILHDIDQSLPYEVHVCHVGRATDKSTRDPEAVSERGKVRLKPFCAINVLTVSSFLVSIGLGVAAILIGGGTALVSIITMSFSSSLACLSQRSYPEIFSMPIHQGRQPPGDLVLRTKNGSYVVVHCTHNIA
ncbi:polyamine transporter 2 [Aspergillus terreus]|uniref:Polyamine transporter 2 n=1 Tax=Aspergillus terreus TaxID=33178 RepID=A0A5M3Z7H6_ASPTE|nr:hypothetical protein ATETN484_0009003100 [Aspergillus terreus]GFF17482.1 polyamine transporter 2 [Aspergillus terreus]